MNMQYKSQGVLVTADNISYRHVIHDKEVLSRDDRKFRLYSGFPGAREVHFIKSAGGLNIIVFDVFYMILTNSKVYSGQNPSL